MLAVSKFKSYYTQLFTNLKKKSNVRTNKISEANVERGKGRKLRIKEDKVLYPSG